MPGIIDTLPAIDCAASSDAKPCKRGAGVIEGPHNTRQEIISLATGFNIGNPPEIFVTVER